MTENDSLREEVKLEIQALLCPVIENPSADVNTVQNSLMDLKISFSKPVDRVNHLEQGSKVQGKPSIKEIFFPSGYDMQRLAASRRVSIKPEKGRHPRKFQVTVKPVKQPILEMKKDAPNCAPLRTPRPFIYLPTNVKPTVASTKSDEFFCLRLKTLVNELNLGRVHFSHNQIQSGRFIASIKVGQEMFPTYPKHFDCPTDAYEYASKLAVEFFEGKLPTWMIPA